jgi:uncharacterized small protein (DUF1192 family)
MSMFDDDRPKKSVQHEIGSDLSSLSVDEIDRRIALLRQEILRLEADRAQKGAGRRAAEDLFKS